jgi:hypothetical protein
VLVFDLHTLPTTITISVITDLHLHKGLLAGGWVLLEDFLMIITILYLLCHQRERNRTYNLHFGVLSFPYGRPLHFWSWCLSSLLFSAQTGWAWRMMGPVSTMYQFVSDRRFSDHSLSYHAIIMETTNNYFICWGR